MTNAPNDELEQLKKKRTHWLKVLSAPGVPEGARGQAKNELTEVERRIAMGEHDERQ